MNYHLTIYKTEDNPKWDEEVKRYDEERGRKYHYGNETVAVPQREFTRDVLNVHLTEEQFKAIKAAVLKAFE